MAEDILAIIGLSIINLIGLMMLIFLLISIIQEAKSNEYGKKLLGFIKEKDKQID
jgi:hypothetical protein